ncbi:fructose-bisphosphate aldolase class I [Chitinispirillales bacterium ANBcel5]|uniref:class I fructose-bisphosphate aldolase n=1 Tax=Cellulosispirillum alkaliphilum TaxID=3039283 RepID=UPI002A53B8A2|nr:fructose-bisphosphate aldolase class I [Chitinispirillales bacterium ANBcel5]
MYLENNTLLTTAANLLTHGKGILAADESHGTITKRFKKANIDSTPESRRAYREVLFTSPGVEQYISGVIMYDETLRQKSSSGLPFAQLLSDKGIVPGIKVDKGTRSIPFSVGEKETEGLDGLRERLLEYRELGAKFTKWRAVIAIGDNIPTRQCLLSNVHLLARFAALSQEAELVPVVEPEVLMDGNHSIETCEKVTQTVLNTLFKELLEHRVILEGLILKTNMVLPGKSSSEQVENSTIAKATTRCLNRTVPPAVPGIAFLSGGQDPLSATKNLDAINKIGTSNSWKITFSYSRALQDQPLNIWKGQEQNIKEAQALFIHRARCNAAASIGQYSHELEERFE